jgi:uncharacterized phage protein (TIGR01671 family)
MREIKYRIWQTCLDDKELQIMHPIKSIDFDKKLYWVETSIAGYYFKDAILMQYIGLKDKNDKEIFEGDLVKHGEELMMVSFSERFASFGLTKKGWLHFHFFGEAADHRDCEVVGNIYMNKELLRE